MNKDALKRWLIAAGVRAVKTAAQTAVTLIGSTAVAITSLDWCNRGRGRVHRSGIGAHLNRRSPGGRGGYLAVCDAALALLAASVLVFLFELGMPQVRTAGKAIPTVYDRSAPAQVPTYLQTGRALGRSPLCWLRHRHERLRPHQRGHGVHPPNRRGSGRPAGRADTSATTAPRRGLNNAEVSARGYARTNGSLSSTGLLYDQQEALGYAGRGWMVSAR